MTPVSGSIPEGVDGERLVRAILEQDRPSWRIQGWLYDLAVKVEPDVENRWWPQSWAAQSVF